MKLLHAVAAVELLRNNKLLNVGLHKLLLIYRLGELLNRIASVELLRVQRLHERLTESKRLNELLPEGKILPHRNRADADSEWRSPNNNDALTKRRRG